MKKQLCIYLCLLSVSITTLTGQEKSPIVFHPSHEIKKQSAPYSDVVEVGNLFFLAGQIGMDHTTRTMVEAGIVTETEQAIKNIKEVLEQHGLTLDNVVKCTVILASMEDFSAFNKVYSKHFTKKPARTTFAAKGLARNASVEIDVIASK
ncbi:Rid family detoxifying hydrolase [Eudoraea chungangensis]|uniref:Rid family detoxifying hydrolase n=1 Tax=Eudoraea chungangensis TaxID=1481905 RepID=UPI0023EC1D87|nr:Rid family detoxifying hydrolase [Eudoraea chungangensis]